MTPEDPRLTARALDALPADERNAMEAELWSDPELIRELEETAAFAAKLKRAFSIELNAALTDDHWREIQAEAAIVGLTPGPVVPMPKVAAGVGRSLPAWAVPAVAGVTVGAVVTSVALTWHDTPRPLVQTVPAAAPALNVAKERATPPVTVSPVVRAEVKAPVVAVVHRPQETPRGTFLAASFHPAAPSSSGRHADVKVVPPAATLAEPVQQTESLQEISFRNAPQQLTGIATAAPASAETTGTALQPAAFREEQSTAAFSGEALSGAPALAFANQLPSLPPLLFVPSGGQSPEVAGVSQAPLSPTPVLPGDGLAGTAGGGLKPVTPGEGAGASTPPASGAQAGDEIAWRRPAFSDALGSIAGGRSPSSGGSGDAELDQMRIDPGMFPTLEHLNTVLEHDLTAHADGTVEHVLPGQKDGQKDPSAPLVEQFCFRHAPAVKVLVILDNGGAPLSVTPNDTPVLDISAPFVGTR